MSDASVPFSGEDATDTTLKSAANGEGATSQQQNQTQQQQTTVDQGNPDAIPVPSAADISANEPDTFPSSLTQISTDATTNSDTAASATLTQQSPPAAPPASSSTQQQQDMIPETDSTTNQPLSASESALHPLPPSQQQRPSEGNAPLPDQDTNAGADASRAQSNADAEVDTDVTPSATAEPSSTSNVNAVAQRTADTAPPNPISEPEEGQVEEASLEPPGSTWAMQVDENNHNVANATTTTADGSVRDQEEKEPVQPEAHPDARADVSMQDAEPVETSEPAAEDAVVKKKGDLQPEQTTEPAVMDATQTTEAGTSKMALDGEHNHQDTSATASSAPDAANEGAQRATDSVFKEPSAADDSALASAATTTAIPAPAPAIAVRDSVVAAVDSDATEDPTATTDPVPPSIEHKTSEEAKESSLPSVKQESPAPSVIDADDTAVAAAVAPAEDEAVDSNGHRPAQGESGDAEAEMTTDNRAVKSESTGERAAESKGGEEGSEMLRGKSVEAPATKTSKETAGADSSTNGHATVLELEGAANRNANSGSRASASAQGSTTASGPANATTAQPPSHHSHQQQQQASSSSLNEQRERERDTERQMSAQRAAREEAMAQMAAQMQREKENEEARLLWL